MRTGRLLRGALGVGLVLHGLAHTLPAMRIADAAAGWLGPGSPPARPLVLSLVVLLWWVAAVGLVAAGVGRLGAAGLRDSWRSAALAGAAASVLLLLVFRPPFAPPGLLLDAALLAGLWWTRGARGARATSADTRPAGVPERAAEVPARPTRRALRALGSVVAVAFVACLGLTLALRPRIMRWGATDEEVRAALPGDDVEPGTVVYAIHHAVTIQAPPQRVWPWLAQLGQDRGGFYSRSRLENLLGLGIRNADRVHPEWQDVAAGDTIFATPPGWLGLRSRFGWRITRAEPNNVLVLENWGAFVLRPGARPGTTRLIVRTLGAGSPRPLDLALAPFGVLLFEPAHFLMQRDMLLGIKRRAEGATASGSGARR